MFLVYVKFKTNWNQSACWQSDFAADSVSTQFQPSCPKLCEDIHVTISRDEVFFEMERILF